MLAAPKKKTVDSHAWALTNVACHGAWAFGTADSQQVVLMSCTPGRIGELLAVSPAIGGPIRAITAIDALLPVTKPPPQRQQARRDTVALLQISAATDSGISAF
jgi:hypothetical protein